MEAFLSTRIVTRGGAQAGAVLVDGERIEAVVRSDDIPKDAKTHDFGELAILPGLVDSHVHINEPGRTEWEGFESGTRAAAAGGYTMLVDMPLNCVPATNDTVALEAKRNAARGKCRVDWAAWGGVVAGNQRHIEALAKAGVRGFKCFLINPGIDSFSMVTERELRAALPLVALTGLPLLVHAELPGPVDAATFALATADWNCYDTYVKSRPDEAELSAIRLLLSLCREYRFRLHVVHLSTSEGISLLQSAKAEGLPVSVETCPHYLYFSAETISNGATLCKCAPPIRGAKNRERLWQGLRDGIIDMIATDHSPCPPAMKEGDFRRAWGGIASLSVALPAIWTEAGKRGFTLSNIARWMSEAPARLAGCDARKGRIAAGYDADFVIFEPEAEFVVKREQLYQQHSISPYMGKKLRGVVRATFLRGKPVFSDGEFSVTPRGKEFGFFSC